LASLEMSSEETTSSGIIFILVCVYITFNKYQTSLPPHYDRDLNQTNQQALQMEMMS
jgi:hypothetical protein